MQNAFVKAEEFADHVKEYINNRIAATKLQTAEKTSKILSNLVAVAVIAAMMLVVAILISMGVAYLLNEWIGNSWCGFMIIGGMWLIKGIVIWLSREKWLRLPIMNKMLQQLFKDEEDT